MNRAAERNGDAGEGDEPCKYKKAQMAAPADGIAGSAEAAEKHERCERDVDAQEQSENIGEAATRERPNPMRERPSPWIGKRLHCHPNARNGKKVLPGTRRLAFRSSGEAQRNENKAGDCGRTRERKRICAQGINQVYKEQRGAEQVAAASAEARGEAILDAARGQDKHHQKEKREGRKRGSEGAAAVALPGRVQCTGKSQHGPQTEHGERAELAHGRQAGIVTERNGGPNSNTGETPRVYRLDARTGVRTDVSDALLRLVDEPGGEEVVFADCMVAAGRNAAGAIVYFFGRRVVCAGDGKIAREGNRAQCGCEANDSARRGNLLGGVAV